MRTRPLLMVALCVAPVLARAQTPAAEPPDGGRLFRAQCATCHTLKATEPKRQGPTLEHVYGRKIGAVEDYNYTPGYREATGTWTSETLDKYLANPSAMFPNSTMVYRQGKPDIRSAIIQYLKEQG